MQEKPSSHPSVLQEKRYLHHLSILNIMTAFALVFVTFLSIVAIFTYGEDFSLFDAWQTIHDGLQSGFILIQGDAPFLIVFLFVFPLIIWEVIIVVAARAESQQKKPSEKKAALVWSIILLGITVFLMGSLLVLCISPCTGLFPNGSDPTCAMPIRPGVSVPTPSQ
jgi:amino acid transporter